MLGSRARRSVICRQTSEQSLSSSCKIAWESKLVMLGSRALSGTSCRLETRMTRLPLRVRIGRMSQQNLQGKCTRTQKLGVCGEAEPSAVSTNHESKHQKIDAS